MTDDRQAPVTRTADEARGGVVVLRHRWALVLFVAGLVGIVIAALAARFGRSAKRAAARVSVTDGAPGRSG